MAWDASSKELEKAKLLLRDWANLSSLLVLAFSAWAITYADLGPQWVHHEVLAEMSMERTFFLAAAVCFSVFSFQLIAIAVEFGTSGLPQDVSTDGSRLVLALYLVLVVNYLMMAVSANSFVFTDALAFGGPRPVYTLRYLERSIGLPLLLAISCDGRDPSAARSEHEVHEMLVADKQEESSILRRLQNLVSIPRVILKRLWTMPTPASTRCTVAYVWCSWLAVVVNDEFTRWLLINVCFTAYVVATTEQVAHCFMAYCYENAAESAALLAIQVVVCGCYGALTLMAIFGIISWQDEQVIITFFDVLAKILVSAYVTSSRRTRSCVQLLGTRLVAANMAEDVRRMVRYAGVPIFRVGRDLRITEWNMKMQEISGLSREKAISMYLADALNVAGSGWWQSGGERLLLDALEGKSGELEMIFSNQSNQDEKAQDSVIAVHATGQSNPSGDITGVLCMGQDVSKFRAAQNAAQALADSRSRLLVSANAPIIELDSEFRIVWWNNWMVDKTGVSVERITGQHLRLLAQSSSWEPILCEALKRQGLEAEAPSFELRLSDLHQCPTTLQLTATPRASTGMDEAGTGLICLGQDITMLKDFDRRKSSLMNLVSDRLKVPLDEMIRAARDSFEEAADSDAQRTLTMISNCAKRLHDMVSNINMASELTRARPIQLHPSLVQLQTVIEEVMLLVGKSITERMGTLTTGPAGLGTRPKIQLINQIRSPLPLIEADEHRCTQLFYNLVANAVKFTHEGTVESSASYDDSEEKLVVRIKDTGIGIAAANLERIFEPFDQEDISESRRYSGLGLGLAISREIARKHGGDITVESEQGHGSTFIVSLPYRLASLPDLEAVPAGMSRLTSVHDVVGEGAAEKEVPLLLKPMPAGRPYTGGQLLAVHTLRQTSKDKNTIEDEDPREDAPGVPSPDPSEVQIVTSGAPSVDAAAVLASTARQIQTYREEIEVARAQAVELEKRVEDLMQRVAQKRDASEQSRQQAACIKQRVLVQRELCKEQSQLGQRLQNLEKAHELQANLLFSQQIKDIYALSTVELKNPTIIEVRDAALEAVKESEADSKMPLQRLTEIAETLEGPERAELLRLADGFGESYGLLQADLGQKQFFLQSVQEQIRNPWLRSYEAMAMTG